MQNHTNTAQSKSAKFQGPAMSPADRSWPTITEFPTLQVAAPTSRARQQKSVQMPGPRHYCDVKSGVDAVIGSPEQTRAVNMRPTIWNLAGIGGRLQCATVCYSDDMLKPSVKPGANDPTGD